MPIEIRQRPATQDELRCLADPERPSLPPLLLQFHFLVIPGVVMGLSIFFLAMFRVRLLTAAAVALPLGVAAGLGRFLPFRRRFLAPWRARVAAHRQARESGLVDQVALVPVAAYELVVPDDEPPAYVFDAGNGRCLLLWSDQLPRPANGAVAIGRLQVVMSDQCGALLALAAEPGSTPLHPTRLDVEGLDLWPVPDALFIDSDEVLRAARRAGER